MKLRHIQYAGHPILGDLTINLVNPNTNEPYKNIFLAGENGAGKSTILSSISSFLNGGSIDHFASIEYEANGEILTASPPEERLKSLSGYIMTDQNGNSTHLYESGSTNNVPDKDNPAYIRFAGCMFSKARADFKTKKIDASRTTQLDIGKRDDDTKDDFTSLKQMLVDIQSQDDSEFANQNRQLSPGSLSWDVFYPTSKTYRFRNAFDNFFENINYGKISDSEGNKTIVFYKYGSEIDIDDLSTGEKQVVFRGSYLLKNINSTSEAVILVDEPELSMHPKLERKITQYYKGLFSTANIQTAQIFFASHSEHCLAEALSNPASDLVIVLNTNATGEITANHILAPHVLPTITSAEVNYIAFDLVSNDYHIHLYGQLQIKETLPSVKACDDFIAASQSYDAARHNKPSQNGRTHYTSLPTYIRNVIHHPDGVRSFTEAELRTSTELLIELCR